MTQLNIFHNTIGLDPSESARMRERIRGQNRKILDFFRDNPAGKFTPFQVADMANITAPITSIRRGITDLTTAGYLVKTKHMKPGQWGVNNHTWQYNS